MADRTGVSLIEYLHSPDERIGDLPGYDFAPHCLAVGERSGGGLRMHHLKAGCHDAAPIPASWRSAKAAVRVPIEARQRCPCAEGQRHLRERSFGAGTRSKLAEYPVRKVKRSYAPATVE